MLRRSISYDTPYFEVEIVAGGSRHVVRRRVLCCVVYCMRRKLPFQPGGQHHPLPCAVCTGVCWRVFGGLLAGVHAWMV